MILFHLTCPTKVIAKNMIENVVAHNNQQQLVWVWDMKNRIFVQVNSFLEIKELTIHKI